MTDREMLEFAAKAAGYIVKVVSESGRGLKVHGEYKWWNPLDNDDDALRLAIVIGNFPEVCESMAVISSGDYLTFTVGFESVGFDKASAVRIAITRAAAEIGKRMP